MNTALASKSSDISGYSPDQIQLIKNTVAVGATDDELGLFLTVCKHHKLDPFTRQIHFVKRAGKGTIQTGIDGFRTIAERTGSYAGNDDPVFDDEAKPTKATVTVWKIVNGTRCPFTATARWSQYYPKGQGFMWDKMPHLMLGKCAEALALRKAFPEALSGLYSDDEMEQAGTKDAKPAEAVEPPRKAEIVDAVSEPQDVSPPTEEQMETIERLLTETKSDREKFYRYFKVKAATAAIAPAMIATLERKLEIQIDDAAKANS